MKWIIAAVLVFAAVQVQATQVEEGSPSIEITSFVSLESGEIRNTGAELCGVVSNTEGGHYMVKVVSDPNYKAPATYMTIPSPEGQFCVVLSTQTGRAEASLIGHHGGDAVPTAKAELKLKK